MQMMTTTTPCNKKKDGKGNEAAIVFSEARVCFECLAKLLSLVKKKNTKNEDKSTIVTVSCPIVTDYHTRNGGGRSCNGQFQVEVSNQRYCHSIINLHISNNNIVIDLCDEGEEPMSASLAATVAMEQLHNSIQGVKSETKETVDYNDDDKFYDSGDNQGEGSMITTSVIATEESDDVTQNIVKREPRAYAYDDDDEFYDLSEAEGEEPTGSAADLIKWEVQ